MKYSLEIENLSKEYNGFKLENVSFKIPKGTIMGLVGENGAGKSTTIKAILNLIKQDSGSIKIFGLDNIKCEKEIKKELGVILDESFFQESIRPVDIPLIMKYIYKAWDNEIFCNYLEKFKLPKEKTIKQFSKGMKMKLGIAVALSHHSKLLILDEPTSGLDPIVRDEILDIFLEFIQDEEHSILLSSHIVSDLEKIADYITFIHEGKLMFTEEKDNLIFNYGVLKCSEDDLKSIDNEDIVSIKKTKFSTEILVKNKDDIKRKYKNLTVDRTSLEEIILFLVKGEKIC